MVFDPLLLILAFLTAVIDIIFGMGFGLTMTPILLFLNHTPKEIVPALLLSSLIGNILSSFFNHRLKNADFTLGGHLFKIVILIGAVCIAGSIAAPVIGCLLILLSSTGIKHWLHVHPQRKSSHSTIPISGISGPYSLLPSQPGRPLGHNAAAYVFAR